MKKIRIGSGAGYGGDRIEPALDLLSKGDLDYIGFECLAERTIALANEEKLNDPTLGYNELLEYRFRKILPLCKQKNVKVITNMGGANPVSAMNKIKEIAKELGITSLKIAAVLGDDVFSNISKYKDFNLIETGKPLSSIEENIISANAYIGIDGIVEALKAGADIIVAGRISDPAIFLAPLVYEFNWNREDFDLIGKGILVGHLLECSSQIVGGYFADPGYKDVPSLWNVGFPIAEVSENGDVIITKLDEAGGMVTKATCKEQILYEIQDPSSYYTPDGVADYTNVKTEEIGKDKVLITGATGRKYTDTLKVSVGYKDFFIGEGEMSYGGPGALNRGRLACEIIEKRLEYLKAEVYELRVELIGVDSIYKKVLSEKISDNKYEPIEVRLRVAGRTKDLKTAKLIGNEVEALYLNGPAGGGGARKYVRENVSIASILIPRSDINISVVYEEV